jgi:hypothetical protein
VQGWEWSKANQSLRALRFTPAFGRAVAPAARLLDAGTEVPAYLMKDLAVRVKACPS